MFEMFNHYGQLKTLEAERDARKKVLKEEHAQQLKEVDADYPMLDENILMDRADIMREVEALGGTFEAEFGKAEVQQRPSWEIANETQLVGWLDGKHKADMWGYTFKKGDINKICTGLDMAGLELPYGIKKTLTPTLVITLNEKHDTERQGV